MVTERRRYHPADYGPTTWRRLVRAALAKSDALECAIPYPHVVHDLFGAPLWPADLETLRSAVTDRHVSLVRWGRLQDEPVQLLRLALTPAVRRYVRGVDALHRWAWGLGRPEDPSFYADAEPVMTTESRSGRVSVYLTDDELARLRSAGLRLLEPLGLEADPWPTP